MGSFFGEDMLHVTEKVLDTWESKGHRLELAYNPVSFLDAGRFLGDVDIDQNFGQAFHTMRRESNHLGHRVDDPAKD